LIPGGIDELRRYIICEIYNKLMDGGNFFPFDLIPVKDQS